MGVGKYDPAAVFAGHRMVALAVTDTGRDVHEAPESAEPVEIGATILDGGVIGDTRTWLVRPSRPITPWATRGHGIGDPDTAPAPGLAEVAEAVRQALSDRIVVAARARHYRLMLAAALPGWCPPRLADLRPLAALVWPWCSQALGALEAQTWVSVPGPLGRARHDAPATAAVFLALAKRLGWPADRVLRASAVADEATVLEGQTR